MSLLDQEVKEQEPKGKKIVLLLLIFSVFALIMVIVMMMALAGKQQPQDLSININGADIQIEEGLFITDEIGVKYISIQKIAKSIGYNYLTGEYKQYNEDTTNTKCYLESINQVIQFEVDTNVIYKIDTTSNLDYEEYELDNKILKQNNLLYLALDDIEVALNVIYYYSESDNKILLNTIESLHTEYKTSLAIDTNNAFIGISDEINNKKAIAYNMLVVSNENSKWGVINNTDFSTIIGNKYSSIEFIEAAEVFIVSDNNKYGVISTQGEKIIDLNYDSIRVINNNPLCYEVTIGENCAIVDKVGSLITNSSYNSVGYISQLATEGSVLVVKELDAASVSLLVVCRDGKYGLLDLEERSAIGDCVLDKVYSKTENSKKVYYIQLKGQEFLLSKYIKSINEITVNVGQ